MNYKKLSTTNILKVYNWLLIDQCYLCHAPSSKTLCSFCSSGFHYNRLACPLCQRPIKQFDDAICGQCQVSAPPYDVCLAPLCFEGLTQHLIHAIKFQQQAQFIRPLIQLLCEALNEHYGATHAWPTQIIFVPSHPTRIKERGFCQTQKMASELYQTLLLQLGQQAPHYSKQSPIKKTSNTPAQHTLSKKKRIENQKGVYCVEGGIAAHVALFDDVMTSGSTLESCTKLLKKAGAKQVDIWVIARTPDKSN
ncbi:ComF family protein [Marinomonas pollencensis]|uniref:ComF family protein n=1 Tax=Marinomonas pollencensis TaxID=491954 RepID=A0A3E0DN38_9GAMM|nr:ComF family protein [Marinomonas pollencensis]REG82917.1 ComF family protein [Marinomonas pollencensis]